MSNVRFEKISEIIRHPSTRGAWQMALGLPVADLILQALSVSRWGSPALAALHTFCNFPLLATFPGALLLPFWFLNQRHRKTAFAWWLVCVIHIPLAIGALAWGQSIRSDAFHKLAQRSKELISAITRYEIDEGRAPESLKRLVPDYLPSVPGTGLRAYPEFKFLSGEDAKKFEGNPWILYVDCFTGSFDCFYYFPLKNYPDHGYGGSFERMGDWAYLHE